jgi:hypothetical protein
VPRVPVKNRRRSATDAGESTGEGARPGEEAELVARTRIESDASVALPRADRDKR